MVARPAPCSSSRGAPRYARLFVVCFLAALVVCAGAPFNLWPFSNWELFSRLRSDRQNAWGAVVVASSGARSGFPVSALPGGYPGFASALSHFPRRSPAQRDASCAAWLRDVGGTPGTRARLLRIYRVEWSLGDRHGPRSRDLAWVCSAKGVRAAG